MTRHVNAFMLLALATTANCTPDRPIEPTPSYSIEIVSNAGELFERDEFSVQAIVRDASGTVVSDVPVTCQSGDERTALISQTGQVVTLEPGLAQITARTDRASATRDFLVRRLTVSRVSVLGVPETIDHGDVLLFGVKAEGEGGRIVLGREVTLASSNPAVALIDRSGRVRAVKAGTATITASMDGVVGYADVTVTSEPARLPLRYLGDTHTPALVEERTVVVNGIEEKRESYLEWGTLTLTGGTDTQFELTLHYAEYAVTLDAIGRRQLALRGTSDIDDRGSVSYDARGDLVMLSEKHAGVRHDTGSISGGFLMRYGASTPATASWLFFRREPD